MNVQIYSKLYPTAGGGSTDLACCYQGKGQSSRSNVVEIYTLLGLTITHIGCSYQVTSISHRHTHTDRHDYKRYSASLHRVINTDTKSI